MSQFDHMTVSALRVSASDIHLNQHDHSQTGKSITTLTVGDGHLTITLHVEGETKWDQLNEVQAIGAAIAMKACETRDRLRGVTPVPAAVDAELASLDERDPGPEPVVIDVDGTIEATGVEVAA